MRRQIVGFTADDAGEWVARLDCLHRQHIRHQPPFRLAAWIEDENERSKRVGATLDCALCDRCELPEGLVVLSTTATWSEQTMPDALRRAHRIARGRWGRLCVERGSLRFMAATEPFTDVVVSGTHAIPPEVEHHVEPTGPTRFAIEFLGPRA